MSNRIKLTRPVVRTRAEMEALVGEIAELKNEQRLLTSEMDARTLAVCEEYEGRLTRIGNSLKEKMTVAQVWAENNTEEFKERKSIDMLHGVVGFRTGMPKLAKLSKWTWDRVLEAIKKTVWGDPYVRKTEEVDKESLIRDHGEKLTSADLRAVGVEVIQEESFFVDPKLTEVDKREVVKS